MQSTSTLWLYLHHVTCVQCHSDKVVCVYNRDTYGKCTICVQAVVQLITCTVSCTTNILCLYILTLYFIFPK